MESTVPAVFDISSEDEELMPAGPASDVGVDDNHDWLKEILSALEKNNEFVVDDDDEVFVVSEVKAVPGKGFSESKCGGDDKANDDDDDDCVVLDGDPDKLKDVVVDEKKKKNKGNTCDGVDVCDDVEEGDDLDDLQIVGEKGQIACRDYPHPRHLCVVYPFHSSPHEKHCDLCHCYVCDSLAPCLHWNTSMPDIDHCHATDKEEKWIFERKFLKSLNNASQLVSRNPHLSHLDHASGQSEALHPYQISQFNQLPQTNQVPSHRMVQLGSNSVSCDQVLRQPAIHVCSSHKNVGGSNILNTVSQSRHNQSGFVATQSRLQPNLVANRKNGCSVSQRDRSRNIVNLGPQFTNSHAMFKRPGSIQGAITRNHLMPRSMRNTNHAQAMQCRRNYNAVAPSVHNNLSRSNRLYPRTSSGLLVHQRSFQNEGNSANTEPTQPQLCPQAQSNLQGGASTGNSILCDSSYVCHLRNQSGRHYDSTSIYYQCEDNNQNALLESEHLNPEWQRNLSQTDQLVSDNVGLCQINQQYTSESQLLHNLSTQPSPATSFQLHIQSNQQPAVDSLEAHSQTNQPPLSNGFHQHNQSNQQFLAEHYCPISTEPIHDRTGTELDSQCIDVSVFDFESSIADNSTDSMAGGLPSQMNILSPEHMSWDANVFNYDYEFPWNDMTPS